jgi:hypothetical protein
MSTTFAVQPPPEPLPEPSASDVMSWLMQIARGLDWGGLQLEPCESEIAQSPRPA